MSRNEERIDELEKSQARLDAQVSHAAEALREQKGALDKLLDSINKLSDGVTGSKVTLRVLLGVMGILCIPIFGSVFLQWGIHTKIGEIDERTKSHETSIVGLRSELTKIGKQREADVNAVEMAALALQESSAKIKDAPIAIEKALTRALELPQVVTFLTLTGDFAADSSEGDAILLWDNEIAGLSPGQQATEAIIIHVASPEPTKATLPNTVISVKVIDDGRGLRVTMAMNSQEDKALVETFFKEGGVMSMDIAIYLAAK